MPKSNMLDANWCRYHSLASVYDTAQPKPPPFLFCCCCCLRASAEEKETCELNISFRLVMQYIFHVRNESSRFLQVCTQLSWLTHTAIWALTCTNKAAHAPFSIDFHFSLSLDILGHAQELTLKKVCY